MMSELPLSSRGARASAPLVLPFWVIRTLDRLSGQRHPQRYMATREAMRLSNMTGDTYIVLKAVGLFGQADGKARRLDTPPTFVTAALGPWDTMASAPRDGTGILAFGVHDTDNGSHWHVGARWWGIIRWDIWREPEQWVFSKDGRPVWSPPLLWVELQLPSEALIERARVELAAR